MSNVKKNQRSEITPVKFKYELDLISDKIIQFLIRDFGVAELSPNLKIFTNNAKMVGEDIEALKNLVTNYNLAIENNYQYWLVEEFRRRILTCLDNVLTDVDYAYSMYPTTVYDALTYSSIPNGDWEALILNNQHPGIHLYWTDDTVFGKGSPSNVYK